MSSNFKAYLLTAAIFFGLVLIVWGLDSVGLIDHSQDSASLSGPSISTVVARRNRECKDDSFGAYLISQTFVKRALKSPSSATFPDKYDVRHLGGCNLEIIAKVDAENAYGAKLRTTYAAKVQYHATEDSWTLLDLQFNE